MPSFNWLINMGASPPEIVIFVMGVAWALFSGFQIKWAREDNKELWKAIKESRDRYYRLDALQYGTAKAIQAKHPDIKLINESADGDGNYSLDRS